ncbi:hypothetical protein HYC85_020173 [Camellia sinensis]|uniref:Uncharacterized protein n=1 Tax=Camellia sinensis TaxID=4442 RepID=A0A7J7GRI2_CAMSI|nr:hypothetical protein HYC85_020173 [Camellia sinensis]
MHECLEWLNSKESNSVLCANYGSLTVMTQNQLIELDLVAGNLVVIPIEFMTETKEISLLRSWCPQEKVLTHLSIEGVLTHCEWNSTLESISSRVPMICSPTTLNGGFNRDEIVKVVRELMVGDKGKEMKKRIMEWRKMAKEAIFMHYREKGYSKLHRSNFEAPSKLQIEPISKLRRSFRDSVISIEDSEFRSSRSNRFRSSVEDSVISIEDSDIRSSIEAPDRTDFEAPDLNSDPSITRISSLNRPGMNLITTIIGFGMIATFIVFVCSRLICGRIRGVGSRQMSEIESRIDLEQVDLFLHTESDSPYGYVVYGVECSTTESSDDIEKQELEDVSDEDDTSYFDTIENFSETTLSYGSVAGVTDNISKCMGPEKQFDDRKNLNAQKEAISSTYPQIERRKKPPDPVEKEKGVSLWSMIKDNVGKDLTRVCLPVYFNEPISSLQKCFEDLEYSYLLDRAYEHGKAGNVLLRILDVASFAVSGYASSEGRHCKPFNPLLGETYEADYPEKGIRFFSEKVLFVYPPEKQLPLKYKDLLSFCFPGGVEVSWI